MKNDLPISAKKKFKYSITFQSFDEESLEIGETDVKGYEVEETTDTIGEILYEANTTYGIYMPVSFGTWESTEPEEDRDFFEKGIRKYYALHIKNEDGTEISQEESDFISFLLSDGRFEINKFRDYAVGGIVLGAVALGVGALITYFYFKGKKPKKDKFIEEVKNAEQIQKIEDSKQIEKGEEFEKKVKKGRAKSVTHTINGKDRKFPINDAWKREHSLENKSQKYEVPQGDRKPIKYEMGGDASEHYYEVEYGEGGVARAKDIITKKIGLNEENADFLTSQSEKFAIWLADSIVEANMTIINGITKKEVLEYLNNSPNLIKGLRQRIRGILDWLENPNTPKQNLRELSFAQAEEKAKQWHDELIVSGGDIDYVEPKENLILKKYPINEFGKTYYWVMLPSNTCRLESSRMGHCGQSSYSDNLISFRSTFKNVNGEEINDSHITIGYGDGLFYQVKGKQNKKPLEKYFPFVFDFIKSLVKGEIEDLSFNGFASEYASKEDYGWEDMTKQELTELYELNPNLFSDFAGKYMLYEAGLSVERPNTTILIEKSAEYVSDLLKLDRDLSDEVVEKVLTGETDDLFSGSWSYFYDNTGDYVDDLNEVNYEQVIDKIVELTGLDKSVVKENGAKHYLEGDDEEFDKDTFDDISRSIASALNSAEEDGYVSYYYKQIEDALSELGTIKKLNYEGVELEIDLENLMSISAISSYLKDLETESLEDVFFEAESQGEIELPNLSIDDRYTPYGKDINEYFDIYEKGGSLREKTNKKTKVKNMKPSQRKLAEGGSIETIGISKEDYFLVVQNWVYFTFNYPMGFVKDAFNSNHLEEKFSSSYERYGSVGVLMNFWANLDGENRRTLSLWIKNNYFNGDKTKLQSISDDNYAKIITHWNMFCFNYPYGFVKKVFNNDHYEVKFTRSYEKASSTGAVNYFFTELSGDNQKLLTDWVFDNYKGETFKDGGGVGENEIDFQNFTIDEFKLFVKSINAYGDIEVSVSVGNNVNKEGTYTKKIELKKIKDLSMSIGDYGKEISVITGSENIYADFLVYDNNYDNGYREYTISLFSKDDKKGLKSVVNSIIEKFKDGGRVTTNDGIIEEFLSSERELKVGNLSTHFNNYDNQILLRNYGTLIATRKGNDVEITNTKHSKTTTIITNKVKNMALRKRMNVKHVDKFADGGEIKEWENSMKKRNDIEFLRIEKTEALPNNKLMVYYAYNPIGKDEFKGTQISTDVIKFADGGKADDYFTMKDGSKMNKNEWYQKMEEKMGFEKFAERELKDAQFGHKINAPLNELTHNRLDKKAVIGKNSVTISSYTPNYKRHLDSITFYSVKELNDYLNKNQILADGGDVGNYEVGDTFIDGVGNRLTITAISKEKGYKVISKDSPTGAWYSKDGLNRFKMIKYANGGEAGKTMRDNYDALVGRVGDEFYFLDSIFIHNDGFKGATGTVVMPVSKEYYEYATSEDGILERYIDATGEDEWISILGLDRDDFEYENDLIKAIEDGIWQLYNTGGLYPFEEVGYELKEQMRALPQFVSSEEFPIFEIIGGGRIFDKEREFDEIYNQELFDKIKEIEEFAKGGQAGKKTLKSKIKKKDPKMVRQYFEDRPYSYAKGGMVVYLDGEKSETFKTKKALYDFVRKQVDTNVKKVEIDYGNRIIPTFDTYIIENGKLIHKGELIQPNIDKEEVERKRLETEKNINKMMGYADGGEAGEWKIGDNFKVIKGIYGDYNSPRYANQEFEVINIRDGKYIDARNKTGNTETFDAKNIEKIYYSNGGSTNLEYSDILKVLKSKIDDSIEEIPMKYENSDSFTGEEVEHESRDGFIPYTDGGYEARWFEQIGNMYGTGNNLPNKVLDDEMNRQINYNLEMAKESFIEKYPELVEELGEENIDYHSLNEAGYSDEAEELSEMESDNMYDEGTIMMQVTAYYYSPENDRGIEDKHTIRLFGDVNLESPYHRQGNLDDSYDIDFTFDSIAELEEKMDSGLKEIISWFDGDMYNDSTSEMKVRRMAEGGSASGQWIIQDWAGNHLFRDKVFDSFEEGWDFIYENVQEETEDDGTYDDYYVVELKYDYDEYAGGGEAGRKSKKTTKKKQPKMVRQYFEDRPYSYAGGGGIENSKEWKEYQVASNNINRFNRQNEFIMVDGKAVMNDVTKMPEYKILNEKFKESLKKVREMEKERNNSYAEGGEVQDWMEEALVSLIEETGNDDLEITIVSDNGNEFIATDDNVEYRVFKSEQDAEEKAIEGVREDMEESPENFNKDFIKGYIDGRDFFESALNEMNYSYVEDIASETDSKYANRLIDELVENGLMDKDDAQYDNAEEVADDLKSDYVDLLTEQQLEEGNDGLEYFISNFGEEETYKMVIKNNLINIDRASRDAVATDGIAHFLSYYDGETLYLSNDNVAYRTN